MKAIKRLSTSQTMMYIYLKDFQIKIEQDHIAKQIDGYEEIIIDI